MEPHQVLFTCAPFLIQTRLQFQKWNTQEKYLLTASQEARLIKGETQMAYGGELAWASKQGWKRFPEKIMKNKRPRGD